MKILALDMATKTGWAWTDTQAAGDPSSSGVENFRHRTGESQGMVFLRFQAWLADFVKTIGVDLIVYEQAHHRGRSATEMGIGLLSVVKMVTQGAQIDFTSVHSSTVKKFATGKGNSGKKAMMAAYKVRWGVDPKDDNECDARWILEYAIKEFSPGRRP